MWKKINSPIVITAIVIVAAFFLHRMTKPKLATEIRAAYEELISVVEDGASDVEKTMAIREFAQQISKQFREGFSAGLESGKSKKDNKSEIFIDTKKKIQISGIKYVESQWSGNEECIFVIKNTSDKYISQLKLNFEFYKGGELIYCDSKWISEIQLLEPNEDIAINHRRKLPESEEGDYASDQIKIKVTSFNIKEI